MIELETAFIYPKWWSFVYIQKYIYIKLIPLKFGAFFVVRDSLCSPWKLIPLKLQPIFRGKKKTHVRFGKVFFSQNQAMEHRFASQFVCPKIPTFPQNPPPQQLPKVPKVFRRLSARKKVRSFKKKTPVPLMVMTVQMVDYAKILRKYSLIYNWSMYVCIRCLEKVTKISLPNLGLIWWCTMVERKNNRKHTKGIGVVVFLLLSQKN